MRTIVSAALVLSLASAVSPAFANEDAAPKRLDTTSVASAPTVTPTRTAATDDDGEGMLMQQVMLGGMIVGGAFAVGILATGSLATGIGAAGAAVLTYTFLP